MMVEKAVMGALSRRCCCCSCIPLIQLLLLLSSHSRRLPQRSIQRLGGRHRSGAQSNAHHVYPRVPATSPSRHTAQVHACGAVSCLQPLLLLQALPPQPDGRHVGRPGRCGGRGGG